MPNGWTPVTLIKPYRVMIVGSGLPRFLEASNDERMNVFLPRFGQMLAEWEELGARVIAGFCDDVFQVGPADQAPWAWYLMYEIDDLDTAVAMIQASRQEVGGVEVQRWVKLELRIGRRFFAREETVPQHVVDPRPSSVSDSA
jgi:hypothetical protein